MSEDVSTRSIAWQIVILVLSVITLVFVAVDTLLELTAETSRLFFLIDTAICVVFLSDVAYRGIVHPDRRSYWRWGWIDLISSIPAVAFLRWGRLIRIVRIARVLRAFRSTRAVIEYLFRDPAQGSVFTVAIATFTLVVFGSVAMLNLESAAVGTNIRTASDALWWSFVTVTTVGYGDHYPVTSLGRMMAALLMAAGVGLFGTLTAYFANAWMVQRAAPQRDADDLHTIKEQLAEVLVRLERAEGARE
ncbi:MAG: ion transporter [Trueperaceae bacterium]|nr:ion transporter [Trueperaceae bacterium]